MRTEAEEVFAEIVNDKKAAKPKYYPATQKQSRKLGANGECVSFDLGSPMGWDKYLQMHDATRRQYLTGLREFGGTTGSIASMLGVSRQTVHREAGRLELKGMSAPGRASDAQKRRWDDFLGQGMTVDKAGQERAVQEIATACPVTVMGVDLCLSVGDGKELWRTIYDRLRAMMPPDGGDWEVKVSVRKAGG